MATRELNGVVWLDRGRGRSPGRFWAALRQAWQVRQTRRQLAEMDDHMLADLGISRAEAYEEARRAPWDTGPRRR